jgi:hypothetical protein
MNTIQPVLFELILLCIEVALIIERTFSAMFVLFFNTAFIKLQNLSLLHSYVTLFTAVFVCHTFPIHLISNSNIALSVNANIDSLISALFITGIVQLFESIFIHIKTNTTKKNTISFHDHLSLNKQNDQKDFTSSKSNKFKLGALKIMPASEKVVNKKT